MSQQALQAVLSICLSVLVGCGGGGEGSDAGESPRADVTVEATWLMRARLQEARQEVGVAALQEKMYVVGGFRRDGSQANTAEAYEFTVDRWQFVQPLPVALDHPAAAAARGKLYVLGGFASGAAVDLTLEYDPQTDRWTARAQMPTRRGALAAAVIEEQVYAVGGFRDGVSVNDLARYDPATDRWEVLPSMPTPRDHLGAGAIKGRLYAVAGRNNTSFTLGNLEEFDLLTRTWIARVPMPTPRSGVAAAVVNDRLFVFGGEGNVRDPRGVFQEVEAFDPDANRWQSLPPMPTPRHGIGAAVLLSDILIPGGALIQGFGATDVHEVLRVQTAPIR
jgi:N-acetylneuraminic acid mutarotase